MNRRLYRSATPGLADYLSLGVAVTVFVALGVLLVTPGGSFTSAPSGQISRALP